MPLFGFTLRGTPKSGGATHVRASSKGAQPGGNPTGFRAHSPSSPYRFKLDAAVQAITGQSAPGAGVGNMAFRGAPDATAPRGLLESLQGAGGILVRRDIHSTFQTYIVPPGNTQETPLGGLTGGVYGIGQMTATALMQYQQGQAYNGQTGTSTQ